MVGLQLEKHVWKTQERSNCPHRLPKNTFRNGPSHLRFKAANPYCSKIHWEMCSELRHLQESLFFKYPTKICS